MLKLNFRHKGKQRLPVRNSAPLVIPEQLSQSESVDFMHDVTLELIKPSKPMRNTFIECCNRTYRTEMLADG
ncbi:hypothetical protein PEC302107_19030 [Pectobacterium araliae]|uniref:Transposase n=1 Tax=Pectobacterium araliae TaxID=3073862 RepID=A0AAN0K996_9GAMM|nr:hypothetical protein PEC302110_09530 [Pectobacterium sp. MAFF 302110]GKW20174.1 hypothetical protein PEC302107_19030 [Pectobacterium carotovorum subsp. carotovorum]